MSRKKWTPQGGETEALIEFREKRKWQIALRRYVLEKNKSSYYAPFFGLDNEKFRNWIETQFDEDLNWENFSKAWQFDHIVPVAYFDFTNEEDMSLCWNFTNIRVEKTLPEKDRDNRIDVLAAKAYFETLFAKTGYFICQKMVEKITRLEEAQLSSNERQENFLRENKDYLSTVASFSSYEYDRLNTGTPLETILYEINFFKKFGT
jgi:hypothetical protein